MVKLVNSISYKWAKLRQQDSCPPLYILFSILESYWHQVVVQEVIQVLDLIWKRCEPWEWVWKAWNRFRVSPPCKSNLVFDKELQINLVYVDGNAVPHTGDTADFFSAACFFNRTGEQVDQFVEHIWLAVLTTYCIMYTAYPDWKIWDKWYVFSTKRWKQFV